MVVQCLVDIDGAVEVLDRFGANTDVAFVYKQHVDALKQDNRRLSDLLQ